MPLTDDEYAQLQALGYGGAPSAGPPAPPASMAAPMATQLPPAQLTGDELASIQARTAPGPAIPPPTNLAPSPSDGPLAHRAPGFRPPSKSGVTEDQTFGMQGGVSQGDLPPAPPPEPLTTTTSGASTTKGIKLSAETKAAEASWLAKQKAAEAAQAAGFQQARDAERKGLQDEAAAIRGNAEAARIEGDEHDARLAQKRAHVVAMFDEVANDHTDPDHWWHSRSTAGKIGAAISIIAGGFVSGFRGGPNEGAQLITQAIDRDISAQRDAHEAKVQGAQAQVTLYNLAAAGFHTAEERHAAARAAGLSAAQKEIQAKIQASQDPLEKAKLLQANAILARETTTTLASLDEKTQDRTTTHSSTTTQKGGPQQGGINAANVVRGPDGTMYVVGDPAQAKALSTQNAVATRLQRKIAYAKQLREEGGQTPGTDAHAQLVQTMADIKKDYAFMNGEKLRQVPNGAQLIEDAVGSPESMFDWHGGVRLDALAKSVHADLGDAYVSAGAVPLAPNAGYGVQGGKPVVTGSGLPNIPKGKGGR